MSQWPQARNLGFVVQHLACQTSYLTNILCTRSWQELHVTVWLGFALKLLVTFCFWELGGLTSTSLRRSGRMTALSWCSMRGTNLIHGMLSSAWNQFQINFRQSKGLFKKTDCNCLVNCEAELSKRLALRISQIINSVQTRCIVKGEAQKSPLTGDFLGVVDFLRSACSLGIPQETP